MKVLSILALVLFVSANSFAQTGSTGQEPAAGASAPTTEAPKMEKHHAKKKKGHKKAKAGAAE